jgi:acyl-CoA dehydrogenase
MPYSFTLSKPLADYGNILRDWSATEVRPYARQADTEHAPPANWKEILDTCPVGLGRQDIPDAEPVPAFEEGHWVTDLIYHEALSYGDIWAGPVIGGGIGHLVVQSMGTPEQVDKWYTPVVKLGLTTAFALTEPHFGSDATQVATTATRDGDSWVLNGTKIFCSGAVGAEYITVFATTDKSLGPKGIAAFVVPGGTPGLVITKRNESKLGIRSWQTSSLTFDNCVIPVENRLGWSGDPNFKPRSSGQAGALGALGNNRPNMAAMAIGLAQASIDVATGILRERRAGFTPQRWSDIESEIENMNAALNRGRRMNLHAQYLLDAGKGDRAVSAAAKGYAPQTVDRVIRRCMQLLGPDGTSQELLLEKWYRDVKIMDIFEGSGQVQRIIVGRTLMGRVAG